MKLMLMKAYVMGSNGSDPSKLLSIAEGTNTKKQNNLKKSKSSSGKKKLKVSAAAKNNSGSFGGNKQQQRPHSHFGEEGPSPRFPPKPKPQQRGVSFDDPETWPKDTPGWAKVQRFPTLKSPGSVAAEWFVGPPAIKHLEAKYGVATSKKGNTWRSGRRRKSFCDRKHLYDFLDKFANANEAEKGLVDHIEHNFKHLIPDERTAHDPGPTAMEQIRKAMKKSVEGYDLRSAQAKRSWVGRKKKSDSDRVKEQLAALDNDMTGMPETAENNVLAESVDATFQ